MKKSTFSPAQIAGILKEFDNGKVPKILAVSTALVKGVPMYPSCFTHFLKTCPESIDFTGLGFENGCPAGIFEHVFAKKEK